MKINRELFDKFYDVEVKLGEQLYITNKTTNKEMHLHINRNGNIFNYGVDNLSLENVEYYIEKGLAQRIDGYLMYKEFTNLSDDELYKLKYGISKKINDFITKKENELNLISSDISELSEKEENKIKDLGDIYFNDFRNLIKTVGLYKKDNEYIAQYLITSVDDYDFIKYIFSKEPSMDIMNKILDLEQLRDFCMKYKHIENIEFINGVHFTETDLSIKDIMKKLKINLNNHFEY